MTGARYIANLMQCSITFVFFYHFAGVSRPSLFYFGELGIQE